MKAVRHTNRTCSSLSCHMALSVGGDKWAWRNIRACAFGSDNNSAVLTSAYESCSVIEGERAGKRGTVAMSSQKQLLKLSEESLMKEPEEVFDLEEKIGEG